MDDRISLKCIHDLLDYNFMIPSYQRGYQWKDQQVNDLLDDIWEFTQKERKSKDEFYCLQPVVVAPYKNDYYVIDGQQRLTTIYIIFSVLKDIKKLIEDKNFTIKYETRKDSENFLQNIDINRKDENIDYYHICRASETVKKWFDSKPSAKVAILDSLLRDDESGKNVKVIWYEIDSAMDPIDIFTRINMGKIPLTNAELVKALFLKRDSEEKEDLSRLRQLELASEWDRIEYSLRDEQFWYFLTDSEEGYENRIELIFDLIANKSPALSSDRYYTFRYFNQRCDERDTIKRMWKEIKEYFLTLFEWFDHRENYHLAGYLIALGEKLGELKEDSSQKTKSKFKHYLEEKIRTHVTCSSIDELNYEEDKDTIKKVLLLFNIITLLNNINSNERFQFDRYKREAWDIEHIHAVQSERPLAASHQKDWLEEVFQFIYDEDMKNRISHCINNTIPESRDEEFKALYDDIVKLYSEGEDIQDISNLALLDSGTNRGLKNAVFPVKRKVIIEKDRGGLFLPLCTKNVFLKYYSDRVEQMTFWGKADRQAYLDAIKQTLARFTHDQDSDERI